MSKATILQKIIERRTKPSPITPLSQQDREEAEVLVAWIKGEVDTSEATQALGMKSTSQIHQRAGSALRSLAKEQHILITWNIPQDNIE